MLNFGYQLKFANITFGHVWAMLLLLEMNHLERGGEGCSRYKEQNLRRMKHFSRPIPLTTESKCSVSLRSSSGVRESEKIICK